MFELKNKGLADLPVNIIAAGIVGIMLTAAFLGYNLYSNITKKVSMMRLAQVLIAEEIERVRTVSYDDVLKIEKPNGKLKNGFVREVVLGKEYREDIGNSVLKHKPVTINVYDSESSYFPLVSVRTEKVSRWYKSGTFDTSNMGVYDETGEQHKGTIKKTGNGTGYVFLKKGAKVNGDVEIYDETNGDVYIYNSIGSPSKKTVIRHIGSSTSSGYIRLSPSCKVDGTVTLENSSNGGLIIENNLQDGMSISKGGKGTGYLKLESGSWLSSDIKVTNESSGPIVLRGKLYYSSQINRTGSGDGLLVLDNSFNLSPKKVLDIEMNDFGSVKLTGSFASNVICYSSKTNKLLTLSGSKLKESGKLTIVNDSNAALTFEGTTSDKCRLTYIGSGTGYCSFKGTLEGNGVIENDTKGHIILYQNVVLHNDKKIKKTGGGVGFLELNNILQGNFTFDSDWYGYFETYGGWDSTLNKTRIPIFYDGAYIYAKGKGYARACIVTGVQVLGRLTFDVTANPTKGFWIARHNNASTGGEDLILPDGYIFK